MKSSDKEGGNKQILYVMCKKVKRKGVGRFINEGAGLPGIEKVNEKGVHNPQRRSTIFKAINTIRKELWESSNWLCEGRPRFFWRVGQGVERKGYDAGYTK